jgi:hypothetical protein
MGATALAWGAGGEPQNLPARKETCSGDNPCQEAVGVAASGLGSSEHPLLI